mmetsp:Transcript_81255/g.161218  ORF Transcript_81255/g.161218 Transcript_81255/m.161218 type:complete len:279 (+) Transcript_81255:886-1722(+)
MKTYAFALPTAHPPQPWMQWFPPSPPRRPHATASKAARTTEASSRRRKLPSLHPIHQGRRHSRQRQLQLLLPRPVPLAAAAGVVSPNRWALPTLEHPHGRSVSLQMATWASMAHVSPSWWPMSPEHHAVSPGLHKRCLPCLLLSHCVRTRQRVHSLWAPPRGIHSGIAPRSALTQDLLASSSFEQAAKVQCLACSRATDFFPAFSCVPGIPARPVPAQRTRKGRHQLELSRLLHHLLQLPGDAVFCPNGHCTPALRHSDHPWAAYATPHGTPVQPAAW